LFVESVLYVIVLFVFCQLQNKDVILSGFCVKIRGSLSLSLSL